MEDHIKSVKSEAAIQTTFNIAGYHNINTTLMIYKVPLDPDTE